MNRESLVEKYVGITNYHYWKDSACLSNEDGNVNENVGKQWIKLQNTITARGDATTWPFFRRRL